MSGKCPAHTDVFDLLQGSWPDSLKQFILQSQHLSLTRSVPPSVAMAAVDVSSKVKVGMTPKKAHEVDKMSSSFAYNNLPCLSSVGEPPGWDCQRNVYIFKLSDCARHWLRIGQYMHFLTVVFPMK